MPSELTGQFQNDPKGFLAKNACLVQTRDGISGKLKPWSKYLMMPDDAAAALDISPGTVATLAVGPASSPTPDRYLPFAADKLSTMQLKGGAQRFVTGPLSGCNIYVVNHADGPWVFHVNSNATGADAGANQTAKWEAFNNAAVELKLDPKGAGKVERSSYSGQADGGLVVGFKDAGGWAFWFQGFRADGSVTIMRQVDYAR